MSYLPTQSICYKLFVKRPNLVLPDNLSSVGWAWGNRVKIIPSQTFWSVHLEDKKNIWSNYKYHKNHPLDFCVNSRQHIMPHNGQLATTIQTAVSMECREKMNNTKMVETFTILSTPTRGLYVASYILYDCIYTGKSDGWYDTSNRVTFDPKQIAYEVELEGTDPHTLEWIRGNLLQGMGKKIFSDSVKIQEIYKPFFYFSSCFFM